VVPANRNTEVRLDGIPAVHPDFAKVAKGGYGGGRPAYGYKAAGGALVVNNEESVVLETVSTMRRGGSSYRQIANAMSEAGLLSGSGGSWNPNQVRRIAQRSGVA
jgi:hypothetical protein